MVTCHTARVGLSGSSDEGGCYDFSNAFHANNNQPNRAKFLSYERERRPNTCVNFQLRAIESKF